MFFLPAQKIERPSTPVPSFILTDTGSTFDNTAYLTGSTKLTRSLDARLTKLKLSLGEHHPDVVRTLSAIGDASLHNGDYDAAMQYYTQALDGAKQCFPAGHPKAADVLCLIGNTSMKLSMYGESKSNFNAALKIYRSAFTDRSWTSDADGMMQHVEFKLQHKVASTLASLGSVEFAEKNYRASNKLFQDALLEAKRAAVTGVALDRIKPSNPSNKSAYLMEARLFVSEMFNNIASVSAEQGDKAAAIKNYNSALALQIQEMGEDHSSVACTLHNIGTMHYRSGEYQLALKSYKQVLKMRRYLFSNEDIRIAEVLLNIGAVHEKANEIERSVSAISAAYRISAKHYGERSVPCAEINASLGSLYARSGCNDLALDYYDMALEIYKFEGLAKSDQTVNSVLEAINFVKKKGQGQVQAEQTSGVASATETWLTLFGNYCGSMCIPNNSDDGQWVAPEMTTSPLIQSHNMANPTTVTV